MKNEEYTTLPSVATNSRRGTFWILLIFLALVSIAGCDSNSSSPLAPEPPERTAEEIMTERPFEPKNINLFDP